MWLDQIGSDFADGQGEPHLSMTKFVTIAVLIFTALPGVCVAQADAGKGASAGAPLTQAKTDLDHGKNAEAIAILQKLAAANPAQKGLQHALGVAYYRTGKLEQARQAFAEAIQQNPQDIESIQLEGLTLFRMGQAKAAVSYLKKAKKWMPAANADASHVLGLCYLRAQEYGKARQAFAEEYGLAPDSAAAHMVMARMLVLSSLPNLAAKEAGQALAIQPGLPMAHFLIGEVDLSGLRVKAAIKEFDAERAIDPTYPPIYSRLGDAYFQLSEYDKAEQAVLKSLALNTTSTGPFILMGKVLLRKHDPQTAVMYLSHAEKMDPSSFLTHMLLGRAYRGIGDEAAAKAEFQTATKIQNASRLKLGSAH